MRSEEEIFKMIAEIRNRPHLEHATKWAMIALLENVLSGPRHMGGCACMGPPGLCVCDARALCMDAKP